MNNNCKTEKAQHNMQWIKKFKFYTVNADKIIFFNAVDK